MLWGDRLYLQVVAGHQSLQQKHLENETIRRHIPVMRAVTAIRNHTVEENHLVFNY